MSLRVRKDGRIFCAVVANPEPGDTYINDDLHYRMSAEAHVIVTRPHPEHLETGEWWWANAVPEGVEIDRWWDKQENGDG